MVLIQHLFLLFEMRDNMTKYKVCVYAISKNEEKFAKRFMESLEEADAVYVLDTGSTDQTVSLLKEYGAHVTAKEINPWRFDVARNEALNLVPKDADICIALDLDEVMEKGWRKYLEQAWDSQTTRASYHYNWSFDSYGNPSVSFDINKIHSRKGYKWTHPVHEVLTYVGKKEEKMVYIKGITVNHYPDASKSRGSYLPLLELSVKEDPEDDRNMHYLGREYMYYQRWEECITTLKKHLNLKKATWKDERCASMRFISRAYYALGKKDLARSYLYQAIKEAPYLRDSYVEFALLEYREGNFKEAELYCHEALQIREKSNSYINETFSWDSTIYDLLSICYYKQGRKEEALFYLEKAIFMNPKEERLQKNKEIMEKS